MMPVNKTWNSWKYILLIKKKYNKKNKKIFNEIEFETRN